LVKRKSQWVRKPINKSMQDLKPNDCQGLASVLLDVSIIPLPSLLIFCSSPFASRSLLFHLLRFSFSLSSLVRQSYLRSHCDSSRDLACEAARLYRCTFCNTLSHRSVGVSDPSSLLMLSFYLPGLFRTSWVRSKSPSQTLILVSFLTLLHFVLP